jgi:uncharacterized protein
MTEPYCEAEFETVTEIGTEAPTLIEGLPGHGLVASIAVEQIRQQLDLTHHGNIVSEEFPDVVTFEDGLVRDPVRVYAGQNPAVMTLQSDLTLPESAFQALRDCVLQDLAAEFDRAIFLAGAQADEEEALGDVVGVATTEGLREELRAADIAVAEDPGVVGGVTGALMEACYHEEIPAVVLIVKAHPYLPDPTAARSVIEGALEPLVEFDIDTTELKDQAEEIQRRMNQIAEQYEQMAQEQQPQETKPTGMFQ